MQQKKVPDGGWGWIVVAGVALINTTNQSLLSLFGLIFGEQLEHMAHGAFGVTLVMSINCMVTNFSGLFTGPVLKTFSTRSVTIFGICCAGIGMIISSYATNIVTIIIGYGMLTGLGLGLIASSTFLAVNSYFKERKSQAVGLSMAGTSIGQMAMPKIVGFLLDEYGYKGTTLILGGLCLQGLVGAMLFHPVRWHMKVVRETESLLHSQKKIEISISTTNGKHNKADSMSESGSQISTGFWQKVAEKLDLELLKDAQFVHIIMGLALTYTCSTSFSTFLPLFLQEDLQMSRQDTTLCMSLLSGADILGRLIIPPLAKLFRLSSRMTFLIGAVVLGVARSFFVEQTDFYALICSSVVIGLVRAATVINQNLTVSEYSPDSKLPAALGLNMVAKGVVVLTLGQILGIVKDYFENFRICIHLLDLIVFGVAASWTIELLYRKFR